MNPLLIDVPESIETERLIVRAPRVGDGAMVNAAIVESIDHLRPWLPWAKVAPTADETEAKMRECLAKWIARTDFMMLLFRKEDGAVVGGSGLHQPNWDVPRFEIGYWGRARFAGGGYIREAVVGIASMAFDVLKARRVLITCDARNEASRRVAERAGFVLEGVLRNDAIAVDGLVRDTCVFALTERERSRLDRFSAGGAPRSR